MLLGAEHEYVGLYSLALQFLHRVLCGLCLQLSRCLQIGDVCQVYAHCISAHLPFHLAYRLKERCALDVANRSSNLGDDEVVVILLAEILHVALYLVGDMRHHLYRLAEIVAVSLLVDHRLVYSSSGERVGPCCLNTRESFVVTEVEVGLHTVHGHIALPMLVWVERARVDIDVGVELLYGDVVSPCL